MISVCLHHPTSEIEEHLWSYFVGAFDIGSIYIVGGPIPLKAFRDAICIDSLAELPDVEKVLLAPQGARDVPGEVCIADFQHPERCLYVFGDNNRNLDPGEVRDIEHKVFIPVAEGWELHDCNAAAITLYDRKVKHG